MGVIILNLVHMAIAIRKPKPIFVFNYLQYSSIMVGNKLYHLIGTVFKNSFTIGKVGFVLGGKNRLNVTVRNLLQAVVKKQDKTRPSSRIFLNQFIANAPMS